MSDMWPENPCKHDFKLAYTMKSGGKTVAHYLCSLCGIFKEGDAAPKEDRLSNMGGETVKQFK